MAYEAILVKENGTVSMSRSFDFLCSQLRNGRYRLRIERYTEPRTLSQNALMWLWFTCIERETVIAGGTSKLTTLQMTDFLRKVQADAATELGIMLPLPEDRYYEEFVSEYKHRR